MKYRLIILSISLLLSVSLFSQIDTEFWFVAPAVSKNHCGVCLGAAPVSFVFTTYDQPATVTISIPANGSFTPIVDNIPANSTRRIELWGDNFESVPTENQMRKDVENRPHPTDPTQVTFRGIHIQASSYISAYYVVEERNNSDIFALKGQNALGSEFFTPFQTHNTNEDWKSHAGFTEPMNSAIDIVAVDPGVTEVEVYPSNEVLGHGVAPFVVTLNQGETYSIIPGRDLGGGNYDYYLNPGQRLNGTRLFVRNGKRIAVTIKDDSVNGENGCWDLLGDQLVPVNAVDESGNESPIIGSEYVVMKGDLDGGDSEYDRIYVLATENATSVEVTDITLGGTTTINLALAGDQGTYVVNDASSVLYVESLDANKPIYVLHVTGAGNGCEIGEAVLPTISRCTGSFKVGFVRDDPQGADKDFYINVLGRTNALDSFRLNGVLTGWDASDFTQIPGTDWYAGSFEISSSITPLQPYALDNSVDIFHLGALHGDDNSGGNYGYFSNYATIKAESFVQGSTEAFPNKKLCYGDEANLVASGGISYQWIPGTYLDDSLSSTPICRPLENIKYNVVVSGASCVPPDTSEVKIVVFNPLEADFNINETQGCAPFEVEIDNQSFGGFQYFWYIDTLIGDVSQSDYNYFSGFEDPPSTILFNNTDSAIDYNIKLIAYNGCSKTFFRNIRIYPEITAGFSADTTEGCDPMIVNYTNLSSGNLKSFFWEFGDGNGVLDTIIPPYDPLVYDMTQHDISHTFKNRGNNDTTFTTWLVVQSPFLCKDSVNVDIDVYPYIDVKFGADTVTRCSPFTINMYNSSVGVSSYDVDFGDGDDSTFLDFTYILHTYENSSANIRIDSLVLSGESGYGCRDTFTRLITIYPGIQSLFSMSDDEVCDSSWINFTDMSNGNDFSYLWDFGDGNTSVEPNPDHLFRNTFDKDTIYEISLKLESPYCTDYHYDTINVHNIVDAGFTISVVEECTPKIITLNPYNSKGDTLLWDFNGDDVVDSLLENNNVFNKTFINNNVSDDIYYDIRLIATNYGCSDTLIRPVRVRPKVVAVIDNPSDTTSCSPTNITFNNLSIGGDLNYYWEFGDGTSESDSIPPAHNFVNSSKNDKNYNVKLTATHPVSKCSAQDSFMVTVYPHIKASFAKENSGICTPFVSNFTNTSTQITNEIYEWDITDGFNSNLFEFNHQFTNTSNSTIYKRYVTLTATNSAHSECFSTYKDSVLVYPQVMAIYNTAFVDNCSPKLVDFTNSSKGYDIDYKWDFDDGILSSQQEPSHTFENFSIDDRNFDVELTVTDTNNCSDDTTVQILAHPYIEAEFSIDIIEPCTPMIVEFTNNSTKATNEAYNWTINGIPGPTTQDVTHTFINTTKNSIGDSIIQLRAYLSTDPICESQFSLPVKVFPQVVAEFTPDKTEGCHPLDVNFTENSNGYGLIYSWDFDDGTSQSVASPSNIFENFTVAQQNYNIKLTVTDDNDCQDDTIIDIMVNPFVDARFSYVKEDECTPFNVSFDPGNTKSNTFLWDFNGDNTVDETKSTKTIFTQPYTNGFPNSTRYVYPRLVTYYDFAPECKDTITDTIVVPPIVFASFSPNKFEGCQPLFVNFTNESTGGVLKYNWEYGDTTSSSTKNPNHTFFNYSSSDITIPVTLTTVATNSCEDDTTINISVYSFVEADFKVKKSADCSPFTVDLTNNSKGGLTEYYWDFGNGEEPEVENPTDPTYINTTGNLKQYTISLEVENSHSCSDDFEETITVYPEVVPDFDVQTEGCHPYTVQFTNSSLYGQDYTWVFGDGATSADTDPEHIYYNFDRLQDSVFKVILKVKSQYECGDSINTNIVVHPKPLSLFDLNNSIDCPPFDVEFTNKSVGKNLTYEWDFNDGEGDTALNTNHTFLNELPTIKDYNVLMTATTEYGCTNKHTKLVSVLPEVRANFTASVDKGCSLLEVDFSSLSENYDYQQYDFNDGVKITHNDPKHWFVNNDDIDKIFVVELHSYSDFGCNDTHYDTITVYATPQVEFGVNPSQQMFFNPDVSVDFMNYSNHLTWYFTWNFGNGEFLNSNEQDFEKTYIKWGDVNNDYYIPVSLGAVNPNHPECNDNVTHNIRILPPTPTVEITNSDLRGCEPFTVQFEISNEYSDEYRWDFDDGTTSEEKNPEHVFNEAKAYNVKLKVTGDGGVAYDYETVIVDPLPEVDFIFKPDLVLIPSMGEIVDTVKFFNQTKFGETYLWEFGDGATSRKEEPKHTYDTVADKDQFPMKMDVTLTAWSENGCESSLTKYGAITVDAGGMIVFPNVFTPHPDGSLGGAYNDEDNHVFHPYSEGVAEYHLEIYTRWGEVIFATDDVKVGWDGYYKSRRVKQGVYVWKVWGHYTNNKEFVKWGDITVLHTQKNDQLNND